MIAGMKMDIMANMEVHKTPIMVADMEVDMVADMEVDMVDNMEVDMMNNMAANKVFFETKLF